MSDQRLLIDINSLDEEFIGNPSLVHEINDLHAEAVSLRDLKKNDLDTVEAELDREIRERGKMTEGAIKAAIQVEPRRVNAFLAANQAKLDAAKAQALVSAVSARSEALKELSKLYVSGFFAIDSTKKTIFSEKIQYDRLREIHAKERLQK